LNDGILPRDNETGSIIAVIATDAPLMPHQLQRVAKRGSIGVGRGGTTGGNNSGDIFLAFSTANPIPISDMAQRHEQFSWIGDDLCDALYAGAVEGIEEAVVNAMVAAKTMTTLRPAGHDCRAIDHAVLVDLVRRYGRLKD
jgi:D-aminopeptidase